MTQTNMILDGRTILRRKETAPLGTISATDSQIVFVASQDCNIQEISITGSTSFALSDTAYWTFKVVNKGVAGTGTDKVVDETVLSNTTKLNGSVVTAYVPVNLTLTTNLYVAKGSSLVLTATKGGSPANFTLANLNLVFKGAV